uniref:Uncharacterized protein n=1 Tax=Oryza punctata TaxID=4537 RepID=A0A0E0LJL0_ORYPU
MAGSSTLVAGRTLCRLPHRSPRRGKAHEKPEGSATSPPCNDGGGRRGKARRRLVYGDGGTPQGTLQAVGAFLRHSPIVSDPETPVQRWLDDVANLVKAAQQQLGTGGWLSTAGSSGPRASSLIKSWNHKKSKTPKNLGGGLGLLGHDDVACS